MWQLSYLHLLKHQVSKIESTNKHIHNNMRNGICVILMQVTSPYGNTLYRQENITHGKFAFTTTEDGSYLACFWVDGHYSGSGGLSINMEWKTGIAARDWDSVARKEKIEVHGFTHLSASIYSSTIFT